MSKSTKEKFYNFVDLVMHEVNMPCDIEQNDKSSDGYISDNYKTTVEYDENMQLRAILTIVRSVTKEGKLQELYWQLKDKYL